MDGDSDKTSKVNKLAILGGKPTLKELKPYRSISKLEAKK